jgi:hypothetical protein
VSLHPRVPLDVSPSPSVNPCEDSKNVEAFSHIGVVEIQAISIHILHMPRSVSMDR